MKTSRLLSIACTLATLSIGMGIAHASHDDINGVRLGQRLSDAETATQGRCQSTNDSSGGERCLMSQGEYFILYPAHSFGGHPVKRISYSFCSSDGWDAVSDRIIGAYGADVRTSMLGSVSGRIETPSGPASIAVNWIGACGTKNERYTMELSNDALSKWDVDGDILALMRRKSVARVAPDDR